MNTDKDSLMLNTMYWWGIPTLFRCKYESNPKNCDIGLVGVPHSSGNGTTERDQHLGPRAVRHVSAGLRRVHLDFNINPWEKNIIYDLGDVPLPEANNNERCIERMVEFFSKIASNNTRVVSIGGDHSITGGIIEGLTKKKSALTKNQKVNLVHFDAHTDTYENLDHFMGAKKSAAHWASYLVKQGNVDANHSTQIGIRGNPRTLDWLKPSYDLGYQVITMDEFRKDGLKNCKEKILSRLDDKPIYITFDLDCLDPTVAPAVANLEPAFKGFSIDEARTLLQSLRGRNIIGGDVVCLLPTKDNPNNITSMTAAAIMFELICLISINLN
ncbi:MAG: agmatinase [Pelagibacteraceae bacterium]|nr:agmatinase [Pelagibacteraceae bacterium]PPR51494.1 MAG: Guanidinopropionase [Alphaproteobacteria bacterium MarineAlpha5_Bin10]|tara:strand:- start:4847 stop:5830 length:984 start_codon:yes stop_codon:yes gene_type:complete